MKKSHITVVIEYQEDEETGYIEVLRVRADGNTLDKSNDPGGPTWTITERPEQAQSLVVELLNY